jgi:hypothetical protein
MFSGLVGVLFLLHVALGQQYVGQPIPNSLPAVTGAEIAYFNVYDSLGRNTTLINYYSAPGGKRPVNTQIKRVVIGLTGLLRNPNSYWANIRNQIPKATKVNSEITEESVAVFCPML